MSHVGTLAWLRAEKSSFVLGMHLPQGQRFAHFCRTSLVIPDYDPIPHDEMCAEYEEMYPDPTHERQRRKLYLAPRNTFKTSLSVAFIIWCMLRNAQIRMLLVRATHDDAISLLFEVKRKLLTNRVIRDTFGRVEERAHTWSEKQINIGDLKEPTVATAGLDVSKTGSHPDIVIVDDPVNETNFQSAKVMMQSRVTMQSLSPVLEKGGSIIVTGTRWAENDLYGWLLREDDENEKLGLPREWLRYIRAAHNLDGSLFFPNRLTEAYLKQQYNSDRKNGYKFYYSWYNNEPQVEGYRLFPPHLIQSFDAVFHTEPTPALEFDDGKLLPVVTMMTVDPASATRQVSDFLGLSVVAFDADLNWWVLHTQQIKALPSVQTSETVYLARHFEPQILLIESGGVDIEYIARLTDALRAAELETSIQSYSAIRDESKGQRGKLQRIGALQPLFAEGKVYIRHGANTVLLQQLKHYPQVDHDDVLDSLAMMRAVARRCEFHSLADAEHNAEDQEEQESWGPKKADAAEQRYIAGTKVGLNTKYLRRAV